MESAFTTSPSNSRASAMPRSDLPAAVGPTTAITRGAVTRAIVPAARPICETGESDIGWWDARGPGTAPGPEGRRADERPRHGQVKGQGVHRPERSGCGHAQLGQEEGQGLHGAGRPGRR